jgi:RNA polymerase sigma-70 factor (ECF subfamily)
MSEDFPHLDDLKAGDIDAWGEAFRHLWPMALRAARHPAACLVPWEAEDVASDAILELISQIDRVQSGEEAAALTVTIAYRRAISLARRKSAVKRVLPDADSGPSADDIDTSAERPELDRREVSLLLKRAIDQLDADTRAFLMEKVVQQMTYQEISLQHRVPIGTVCTKVARGLKRLRAELHDSPRTMKELQEYLR